MYPVNLTNSYFPGQADDEVRPTTVGGILSDAARAMPNSPALVEAHADGSMGRAWTYEELLAAAMRQAAFLAARFAPGERIAVWSPNTPEWAILEFAAAMAGLTLVTVNPAYQRFVAPTRALADLVLAADPFAESTGEAMLERWLDETIGALTLHGRL